MMPGGHLASSIALFGGAYAAGSSMEFAAGCVLGGFLIDVDHYVDYVIFERQWRRPGPSAFLRYYFEIRFKRIVLPLHSLELMTLLMVLAAVWESPLLLGYLAGAGMHLVFDMLVNGEHVLRRPVLFYSLIYRAQCGFRMELLLETALDRERSSGASPMREFFRWRPRWSKKASAAPDRGTFVTATLPVVRVRNDSEPMS